MKETEKTLAALPKKAGAIVKIGRMAEPNISRTENQNNLDNCGIRTNTHISKKSVTFSVIVPISPDNNQPLVLEYLERFANSEENMEIILSKGRQPSRQRNEAAKAAKGEILVFLDDDSCPDTDFFNRLNYHFKDSEIAGVGGPNLALATDTYIPNLVNAVLTSRVGVLSKRSRYGSFGTIRRASDSDLILCNFAIRKKLFLESGGLCEKLYPNEENEFFERFTKMICDGTILYDPRLIVRRPRSDSILAFLKKIYGYGKGRAQQFKCRKSLWSSIHMFGGIALLIPAILVLTVGWKYLAFVLALYGTILLFCAFSYLVIDRQISIAIAIAPITAATHISYVLGLWSGLLIPVVQPKTLNKKIELEHVNFEKASKLAGDHAGSETISPETEIRRSRGEKH